MKKPKRSSWRHPIRDRVQKRRRLLAGERKRRETKQDRQNFIRKHNRGYEPTPKGTMLKKRMHKRRAKNKVARASRKRNRV